MELFCFGVTKSQVQLTYKHRMVAWLAVPMCSISHNLPNGRNSSHVSPCHPSQASQPVVQILFERLLCNVRQCGARETVNSCNVVFTPVRFYVE